MFDDLIHIKFVETIFIGLLSEIYCLCVCVYEWLILRGLAKRKSAMCERDGDKLYELKKKNARNYVKVPQVHDLWPFFFCSKYLCMWDQLKIDYVPCSTFVLWIE